MFCGLTYGLGQHKGFLRKNFRHCCCKSSHRWVPFIMPNQQCPAFMVCF